MELVQVHMNNLDAVLAWLREHVSEIHSLGQYMVRINPTYVNTAARVAVWHAMDESWRITKRFSKQYIEVECNDSEALIFIKLRWG